MSLALIHWCSTHVYFVVLRDFNGFGYIEMYSIQATTTTEHWRKCVQFKVNCMPFREQRIQAVIKLYVWAAADKVVTAKLPSLFLVNRTATAAGISNDRRRETFYLNAMDGCICVRRYGVFI